MTKLEEVICIYRAREFQEEYGDVLKDIHDNPCEIGMAYTTMGDDNEYDVQVNIDIQHLTIDTYRNGILAHSGMYNSEDELADDIGRSTFDDMLCDWDDGLDEGECEYDFGTYDGGRYDENDNAITIKKKYQVEMPMAVTIVCDLEADSCDEAHDAVSEILIQAALKCGYDISINEIYDFEIEEVK